MALANVHKPTEKPSTSIRCECGVELSMIPDAGQMGRIIENHAIEHGKRETAPAKAEAVFEIVQDRLIRQVLKKAAKA